MGAASIVVARRALGSLDFPFVFGGDGATMLVPNDRVEATCQRLAGLARLSQQNYKLDLRIGVVGLAELRERGEEILVGRFEITSGRSIAILKGRGLTTGEKLIKSSEKYIYHFEGASEVDLSGLSCRWSPVQSRRGKILTILVSTRRGETVYEDFLGFLDRLLPEGVSGANPIHPSKTQHKSFVSNLTGELKLYQGISLGLLKNIAELILGTLIFRLGFPALFFNKKAYTDSMSTHSDYRKFDDMLRMVIDCTPEEIQTIRTNLRERYEAGEVFFGLHEADSSLMTCFVEGLGQGEHIHFVDAEDGGYAAAAVGLKAQMKAAAVG